MAAIAYYVCITAKVRYFLSVNNIYQSLNNNILYKNARPYISCGNTDRLLKITYPLPNKKGSAFTRTPAIIGEQYVLIN